MHRPVVADAAPPQYLSSSVLKNCKAEHRVCFPSLPAMSNPLLCFGYGIFGMHPFHPRRNLIPRLNYRVV